MKGKINTSDCNKINEYIGNRIRLKRRLLGVTQVKLSSYLGVTFQQIQKYENGKSRVSASSLLLLAYFFDINPSYFFDGYEGVCDSSHDYAGSSDTDEIAESDKYLQSFMKLYNQHSNNRAKKLILAISELIFKEFREYDNT